MARPRPPGFPERFVASSNATGRSASQPVGCEPIAAQTFASRADTRLPASANAARGIQVYDITGKKIGTCPVTNNMATVNTSTYNSGLYFYQLFDKDGIQMNVGKFSVVK